MEDTEEHGSINKRKKRGPYKTYLFDSSLPIPRATISTWNKKAKLQNIDQNDEPSISSGDKNDEETYSSYSSSDDDQDSGTAEESERMPFNWDDEDLEEERIPFYIGSTITQEEAEVVLMSFAIRHQLTDVAIEDMLKMIHTLFPSAMLSFTKYKFLKRFSEDKQAKLEKNFFCEKCYVLLETENDESSVGDEADKKKKRKTSKVCPIHHEKFEESTLLQKNLFFITLSLQQQLENLLNGPLLGKMSQSYRSEIREGEYCKNLENNMDIFSKDDLTLQFNTDGVNPFHSSKNSIWPILVCINELPYHIRRKHIMLCGVWFNSKKPDMSLFLSTFVQELKLLHEEGIVIKDPVNNQSKRIRFHLILCSVDSVARPLLQNLHQYNGSYGCTFCLHPGMMVQVGAGHSRVYPAETVDEYSPRTLKQHFRDCKKALLLNEPVNGVKGPTILSYVRSFDVTQCFSSDYLHNILLGVVKMFFDAWFLSSNHEKPYYVGKLAAKFDEKLLDIKPPCEITRTPRTIKDRNLYKGSEWKNLLLYYSYPCLLSIGFPREYLSHWALLIHGIYIFLKPNISSQDAEDGEGFLQKFVADINKLYGVEFYKFNVHLILHIPKCVQRFGPLWCHSTFCYEHHNGVLKDMFHNSRGVPQQICKRFLQHKKAETLACKMFKSKQCPDNVKELLANFLYDFKAYFESNAISNVGFENDVKLLGVPKKEHISISLKVAIRNILNGNDVNTDANFYASCIIKGIRIHAVDHAPSSMVKRLNSFITLRNGQVVSVRKIVQNQNESVFLEVYNHCEKEVHSGVLPHKLGNIYKIVEESPSSITAILPSMVESKCVVVRYTEDSYFVSTAPNKIETD